MFCVWLINQHLRSVSYHLGSVVILSISCLPLSRFSPLNLFFFVSRHCYNKIAQFSLSSVVTWSHLQLATCPSSTWSKVEFTALPQTVELTVVIRPTSVCVDVTHVTVYLDDHLVVSTSLKLLLLKPFKFHLFCVKRHTTCLISVGLKFILTRILTCMLTCIVQ